MMNSPLNNQFLDDDDELYQQMTEGCFDPDEEETGSSEDSSFDYRLSQDTDLQKYLRTECELLEPERKTIKFKLYSDDVTYKGKPLKEIDPDHFIFAIEWPEKKLKKIDIMDISVFIE